MPSLASRSLALGVVSGLDTGGLSLVCKDGAGRRPLSLALVSSSCSLEPLQAPTVLRVEAQFQQPASGRDPRCPEGLNLVRGAPSASLPPGSCLPLAAQGSGAR